MAFRPIGEPARSTTAVLVPGYPSAFDPYAFGWSGIDEDWPRRHVTKSSLLRAAAGWAKDVTGSTGYHTAAQAALDAWDRAHDLNTAAVRMAEMRAAWEAGRDDDQDDEDDYPF